MTVLQYLCPIGILAYVCIMIGLLHNGALFYAVSDCRNLFDLRITVIESVSHYPKGLLLVLFRFYMGFFTSCSLLTLIKKWAVYHDWHWNDHGRGFSCSLAVQLSTSDLSPNILLALVGIVVVGTIFSYTVFLKGTS